MSIFIKVKRNFHLPYLAHFHLFKIITKLFHVVGNLKQCYYLVYLLFKIRFSDVKRKQLVISTCSVSGFIFWRLFLKLIKHAIGQLFINKHTDSLSLHQQVL